MASSLLSNDRSRKRGRTDETANFFLKNANRFPRFHVVHSEDPQKTARQISPFVVTKTLTEAIGQGYNVKKLPNGDLLLEIMYHHQNEKLPTVTSFGECPVNVTKHRSLNMVRGVISDDDLKYLSEEELLEGLREQNVINVFRIKIRRDNKEIPTRHLVLTFESSTLPEAVEVGYTKIKLKPYIPNPRRCFKCQRYGHGSQTCRGQLTCAKCASHEHPAENCESETHLCINCEGSHAAYSRTCPTWKQEKDIITLKVKENLTYREARKKLTSTHTPTYSVVTQKGAASQQSLEPAQVTHGAPKAGTSTSPVEVAGAAPPPPKQAARASRSAGPKVSPVTARSTTNVSVQSAQSSSTSEDAMDTTNDDRPGPSTSDRRRSSLERTRKEKARITGPEKT